jgi:hypothetical protein
VRLTSLQRHFLWPADVPLVELRSWIRQQLAEEGDVLRWALTGWTPAPMVLEPFKWRQ